MSRTSWWCWAWSARACSGPASRTSATAGSVETGAEGAQAEGQDEGGEAEVRLSEATMTRAIVMLAVLLVSADAFPAGRLQEQKTGTIEVLVFDITGVEIPKQYTTVGLFTSGGRALPITFRDGVAENVPYGAYDLAVSSPGFYTERRSIKLFRARAVYHFTLEVGSVAD